MDAREVDNWVANLTLLIDTGIGNSVDSLDDSVAGDIECFDLADTTIEDRKSVV